MRPVVVCLLLAAPGFAQTPEEAALPVQTFLSDIVQARSFAMGGAYHAVGYGTEVIGGNPALVSMYRRYQVELGGAWDIPNGFGFGGVSVVDSASTEVAMGVSYHLVTFKGRDGVANTAHLNETAIAYPIADWLHVGVSARHQLIYGPYATNSITMGAGVAVRLFEVWVLGFSAHNIIGVNSPLVNRYFVFSTSALFGLFTPTFEARLDFNAPFARAAYSGGLEWIIAEMVPVRAGFSWDGIAGAKYVSFGSGFFMEGSGFDIAYRHEIGGNNGRLISLTVKLQSR